MNKQIEVITYEQDRLNFFVDQVSLAQKKYDRLFKTFKDAPYLSEGAQFLSDAGRELQFYKDVVEMLDKGYRKQGEGEWVVDAWDGEKFITIPYVKHEHTDPYCSLCKKSALLDGAEYGMASNFCPNCGAKMKGDEGK